MKRIGLVLVMLFFGVGVLAQEAPRSPESPPNPPQPLAPPAMLQAQSSPQAPAPPSAFQGQQPPNPARPSQRPVPNTPSVQGVPNVQPAQPIPAIPAVPPVPPDPLSDVMFPPDLILGHSREIMLTSEQKGFMRGEVQKTTSRFTELQWELHDAMEELHQTLESTSVDDQKALALLDKVLGIEREIKRLHVGMGIRLKNKLTPEQQAKLQSIRMGRPPFGAPRADTP